MVLILLHKYDEPYPEEKVAFIYDNLKLPAPVMEILQVFFFHLEGPTTSGNGDILEMFPSIESNPYFNLL